MNEVPTLQKTARKVEARKVTGARAFLYNADSHDQEVTLTKWKPARTSFLWVPRRVLLAASSAIGFARRRRWI